MVTPIMGPAKRRILFLATTSEWGGVQHFLVQTARAAQDADYHVLVAAGGDGELGGKCRESGIPFTRLAHLRRDISPIHDLASIYELQRLFREYRPDMIHLNSSKMGIVGSIASKTTNALGTRTPSHYPLSQGGGPTRIIYRIGGWVFREQLPAWKRRLYIALEKWTARYKDIIVTVHPEDEAIARNLGIRPRDRVMTIPNGIDLPVFDAALKSKEDARAILGLDPDAFVVGTVANFYPPKNIPWLLNAISTFQIPNSKFLIIGDGPERAKIQELHHELGLDDRVLMAGRRTDAATLLRAFDVFLLPSTKEGMPWTLLEAMAARLPCVATNVGACAWMLKDDAGVVIPTNDADALFNAIRQLADHPDARTTLGTNARTAVETRFTWRDTIAKTLSLF